MNNNKRRTKSLATAGAVALSVGALSTITLSGGTASASPTDPYNGSSKLDSFTLASVGDFGPNGAGTRAEKVLDGVGKSGVDAFVMNGDLSYSPPTTMTEQTWCNNVNSKVPNAITKFIVSGNHEAGNMQKNNGLIDNYIKPGCLPNTTRITTPALKNTTLPNPMDYAKEYYVDRGKQSSNGKPLARMIFTSPGMDFSTGGKYTYTKGNSHYNWLSNSIDDARSQGIKWVIVVNHNNYFSMGEHVNETGSDYYNLLASKKVDLNINGHDHTYQRSKQLSNGTPGCASITAVTPTLGCIVNNATDGHYTKGKGMFTVIAGNGGKSFHSLHLDDSEAPYMAKYMTNDYQTSGFLKLSITPTELKGNFIPTTGTFTDSFRIDSSTTTPPPPSGTTKAFTANADTYVDSATPTANYGKASTLGVDYAPSIKRTYLGIPVSGVSGKTITSVKLRFYVKDPSASKQNIVKTTGTWSEGSTVFNNRPGTASTPSATMGNLKVDWNEVSLPVSDIKGDGVYNYGVHPSTSADTDGLDIASRESAGYAPQLVIATK